MREIVERSGSPDVLETRVGRQEVGKANVCAPNFQGKVDWIAQGYSEQLVV
jgi:hypothetical protein